MKPLCSLGLALLLLSAAVVSVGRAQEMATVVVAGNPTYGSILTDADGWTLYTWEGDEPGDSYCADQCAAVWPPLLVDDSPVTSSDLPGTLGMIERDDGGVQATFNDWPLYYFSGDAQPGDSHGQGSQGFGAPWSIVVIAPPAPPPVAALPPPPAAAPPSGPASPPPAYVPPPPPPPPPAPLPVTAPVARSVTVTVADFSFQPATLNVQVGDTVTWMNNGPAVHTATSDTGVWDTGRLNRGQSASYTFTTAGTFAYHCAIHASMHGTITVGGGATAAGQPAASSGYPSSYGAGYAGSQPSYSNPPSYPSMGNGNYANPPDYAAMGYGGSMGGYPGYMSPYGGSGYPGMGYSGGYGYPNPAVGVYPPPPPVPIAPFRLPAPTGLIVTGMTATTVSLQWAASPGAVRYQVHQTLTPTGSVTPAAILLVSSPSATVAGLAPNTTYYFHVHAMDAAGNLSPESNAVTARTTP